MVGIGVHCAEAVGTSRKTSSDIYIQFTISTCRLVDALEEGEDGRIRWVSGVDRIEQLDGDMCVSDDESILELLRSTIVVGLCVDKVSSDHVLDEHLYGKLLVGGEGASIGREGNLCSGHRGRGDDVSENNTIAASINELLAIGESLSLAEVDEVVGRRERCRLASNRWVLAIVSAGRAEDGVVQGKRILDITAIVTSAIVVVVTVISGHRSTCITSRGRGTSTVTSTCTSSTIVVIISTTVIVVVTAPIVGSTVVRRP